MNLHRQFLSQAHPMDPRFFKQGRMSVSGRQVLDESGNPWVGRGANYGHGELMNDTDAANIAARGFNVVRIIPRWWGTWGGSIINSEDDTQTSLVDQSYLLNIYARCVQAKLAGLKVILAFDSNCGQSERVGDATCAIGTGSPQTLWTAGGATKRAQFKSTIRWYVRALLGLVDFVEPIVEPFPSTTIPTGDLTTDVQLFQDEVRKLVLLEDPNMLFIIGPAPSYQSGRIYGWFNPAWASQSNTVYTCNLLDNAATDAPGLPARIQKITDLRNDFGAPVFVQQVGTQIANDPDHSLLANVLNLLNTAVGGSIGWTVWEWVSQSSTSYGPYSGNAYTRVMNSARMFTMTSAANAPRTFS